MKDLGSPAITPALDHAPAFPIQGIGEQKMWGIGQVLVFMHDHQAFASIPLQPDRFGEYPKPFLLPIARAHPYRPEAFWMLVPQFRPHFIHAPPVPLPLDMPRDFNSLTQCLPRLSIRC